MSELKPCPFCGGKPYVKIGMMQLRFFRCNNCGAVVSFDSDYANRHPEIAEKLWDRRAEDISMKKLRSEYEDEYEKRVTELFKIEQEAEDEDDRR